MSWLREPNTEPISGYRLIEPLGTGGFGEVWKCQAPGGIDKAIKFVYGNLNSLEGEGVKAEQELKALQKVKEVRHPFVLQLDRIETVSGEVLIVMELADKSLHDLLEEARSAGMPGLPRELVLRFLHDAAEGLDYLIERHNLLHLDVKPRNLFLVADRVKVADFGLVKQLERQSSTGLMGGISPFYAAPETFANRISKHSDQYSLAIVYMELVTGQRPYRGKNIRQLALQHMNSEPDLEPLPADDRPAVARALSKDPDQRFPNCLSFIRALAGLPAMPNHGTVSLWSMSLSEMQLPPATVSELVVPLQNPPAPGAAPEHPGTAVLPQQGTTDPAQLLDATNIVALEHAAEQDAAPRSHDTSRSILDGVLRPSLVIGIGSFGRRALLEMRCRLLDRIGELSHAPIFRFLYVDSDPEAPRKAMNVSPDIALTEDQLFPLPLQPVSAYRRKHLDMLNEWLPTQKLYSIPRSLQPNESRALGRLAFCDHYLRFISRVRRELRISSHPEAISYSASQTGIPVRSNHPRIYLFADATSGSGGALMDFGVALRDLLNQERYQKAEIYVFLFCGSPNDPATPKHEQANLVATLTELNHYADSAVSFSAQYAGPDGPSIKWEGLPFTSVYLLPLANRSPEALRDAIAHLSTYLGNELTTSLGSELQQSRLRRSSNTGPFRGFGTYSVWFPRGLMLREAARQMSQRLVEDWQASNAWMGQAPIESVCAQALADPDLQPNRLRQRVQEIAARSSDGTPTDIINQLMGELEEEAVAAAPIDPSAWARQTLDRFQDTIGVRPTAETEGYRKSRAGRIWCQASQTLAAEIEKKLTTQSLQLLQYAGSRIAAAESGFRRMGQFCEEMLTSLTRRAHDHGIRSQRERAEVQTALDSIPIGTGGGFRLFGSSTRTIRQFLDKLRQFAHSRMLEDMEQSLVSFYRDLFARLEDRLGDLSFCRQRLNHLQQALGQPLGTALPAVGPFTSIDERSDISPVGIVDPLREALRGASNLRVILPKGELELETSATSFLQRLGREHWLSLDNVIQSLVLEPFGGLFHLCLKSHDLMQHLATPMIEQTAAFLGELLPVSDVAQVTFSAAQAQNVEVRHQLHEFHSLARPLFRSGETNEEVYLLVPSSSAGHLLGEEARQLYSELQVISAPALTTDLMICREQPNLPEQELKQLIQACQGAYDELCLSPQTSPHSRFDVIEWIPLHG